MISRYRHEKMFAVWNAKFEAWWEVEWAVLKALARHGVILVSEKVVDTWHRKVTVDPDAVSDIEAEVKHDVIAFVQVVSQQLGDDGKWVHCGLTSSDVIDTAFSLQLKQSAQVLQVEAEGVFDALKQLIDQYGDTMVLGRTHGVGAQPLMLGHKFALWGGHFGEAFLRVLGAIQAALVVKLSGAVGNYPIHGPDIERSVGEILGLEPVTVASQVVGRHLHADVMGALAVLMGVVEKIAVDIRHHHSHGGELQEGFSKGQRGSSAMPHKKNPVSCENLTGLARIVRGYAHAAFENIALWMERDISHSSVERVIFPDAFELCAYGLRRLSDVLSQVVVDETATAANIEAEKEVFYSQLVYIKMLLESKGSVEDYRNVQRVAFAAKASGELFLSRVKKEWPNLRIDDMDLSVWRKHTQHVLAQFEEVQRRVIQNRI